MSGNQTNTENEAKIKYLLKEILASIIMSIFFLIFYILTFISLIRYCIFHRKQPGPSILIHWLDYLIFLIRLIIFISIYLAFLFSSIKEKEILDYRHSLTLSIHISFYLLLCSGLSLMLLNSIQSYHLCSMINKIVNIKVKEPKILSKSLDKIGISKTTKKKYHIIEVILIEIFNLALVISFIYSFQKNTAKIVMNAYYLLNILMVGILALQAMAIYIMKFYKQKILENNFYHSNLRMQAIYNINASKIVFFNDFLTYKSVLDFFNTIPALLFFGNGHLSHITLFIMYLVYCVYLIFIGAMFLYVDKSNKGFIPQFMRRFYKLDKFRFSFGEKEKAKLFDEYLLDYDFNADGTELITNVDIRMLDGDYDKSEVELNETSRLSELRGYQPVNFYLLIQLMFKYFKDNCNNYKQIEEIPKEKYSGDYANTIEKFITAFKIPYSSFLTLNHSIEHFNSFHKLYNSRNASSSNKDRNSNAPSNLNSRRESNECKEEIQIESFNSSGILAVYPYFKVTYDKIIQSLDPESNKQMVKIFYSSKIINESNNNFFTYDKYLMFEVYDLEDKKLFSNKNDIDNFGKYYSEIMSKYIKENKKTFLPCIIGMFRIKYFDYEKLVVLYKNPFAFCKGIIKPQAALLTICEDDESINRISGEINKNELIQSMTIEEGRYENISAILDRDIEFIKGLQFVSFFKINIFIITDVGEQDINREIQLNEMESYDEIENNNKKIIFKIYISEIFRISYGNIKGIKLEDNNSDSNSTYCKYIKEKINKILNPNAQISQ